MHSPPSQLPMFSNLLNEMSELSEASESDPDGADAAKVELASSMSSARAECGASTSIAASREATCGGGPENCWCGVPIKWATEFLYNRSSSMPFAKESSHNHISACSAGNSKEQKRLKSTPTTQGTPKHWRQGRASTCRGLRQENLDPTRCGPGPANSTP